MTKEQARNQALAASGGALTVFIGLCHEFVGLVLFPWGEAFFGGPVGWHLAGLICIAVGVGLFAGALRLVRFPVVPVAIVLSVAGVAVTVITAVLTQQFHLFALTLAVSGVVIAYCHPRSLAHEG